MYVVSSGFPRTTVSAVIRNRQQNYGLSLKIEKKDFMIITKTNKILGQLLNDNQKLKDYLHIDSGQKRQ